MYIFASTLPTSALDCLPTYLSALPACLPACLHTPAPPAYPRAACLPNCPTAYPHARLSTPAPDCLPAYLRICLLNYLPIIHLSDIDFVHCQSYIWA